MNQDSTLSHQQAVGDASSHAQFARLLTELRAQLLQAGQPLASRPHSNGEGGEACDDALGLDHLPWLHVLCR